MKTLIAIAAVVAAGTPVFAQNYPSKPVRFISPYAPGGGTDIMARTLAQKLSAATGQQFIVENRAGGGGIVGTEAVARSAPDGYTILLGSKGPLTVNPALYRKLPYNTLRDFTPLALVAMVPGVLAVHPSLPVKSVKELLALARAKPGQLTFSSSGGGGTGHLSGEQFAALGDVKLIHVPYRGTGPATIALLSGEVTFGFGNLVAMMPHVQSKQLRAIAVTSVKRLQAVPDLPTVEEAGLPGYEYVTWYGVLAPAGTPRDIVTRLNAELMKIAQSPEMKQRLAAEGGESVGITAEEFAAYIKAELKASADLVKRANIKPE